MIGTGSVFAKTKLTVGTWLAPESFLQQYGEMAVFMEQNPDIELEVINIAAHGEYAAKILVLAATGSIPDVLMVPPEQVAPIVNAGILENLQPWMDNDGTLDTREWLPGAMSAMQFNDITFGMPAFVVNYTYAYNPDILNERGIVPPAADSWVTWNQIRDIGRRSSVDVDGDGEMEVWGFFHGHTYTELLPLLFQAGGFIFDYDMLLNLDQPAMYEGVNWLLDLIDAKIHGGSRADFYQSRVATMRLGSFEMTNIFNNQTPVAVTSGIQYKTKGEVSYVTSYTMTKQSQSKDAAWRYLKFLTSREAQQFVVERSRVPMRRDVRMPDTSRTMLTGLINSLGTAMGYPYHVESNYIQSAVNSGMARVWTREVTPAAAIPEIQRTVNAYLLDNR
jgi:multiple sugar transport system substrate-binding protein